MKCSLKIPMAILAAVAVIAFSGFLVPLKTEAATQQQLVPGDAAAGDKFGGSVVIDGNTAVVGAWGAAGGMGTAYVFIRSGGTWSQQAKLTPGDGAAGDAFGYQVAISGETVAIGAYGYNSIKGAVYVFVRNGTTWSQQAKLTAGDAEAKDYFGISAAIEGDTIIAGAIGKADSTGTAYVFTRSGGTWSQQAKLAAGDAAAKDQFGRAVAISGNTVIVGAIAKAADMGAAYVFTRSGSTWSQQAKFAPEDGAAGDNFGLSVALSGETAFVGSPDNEVGKGAVYYFTRSGSTWSHQTKLTASDSAQYTYFGRSVAIDGDYLAVGRYTGMAYILSRSAGAWNQQAMLAGSDVVVDDYYGRSVDISGDTLLVGAHAKDANKGAVYVFNNLVPSATTSVPATSTTTTTTTTTTTSSVTTSSTVTGSTTTTTSSQTTKPATTGTTTTPATTGTTATTTTTATSTAPPDDGAGIPWWLIIGVGAGLIAGVAYYIYRKSRG